MGMNNTSKSGSGVAHFDLGDANGRRIVHDDWFTHKLQDITDTSPKTLALTGYQWIIRSIWLTIITSPTVGDRNIEVVVTDSGGDVMPIKLGTTIPASTTVVVTLAPGLPLVTTIYNNRLLAPFPQDLLLNADYSLVVRDGAAVAIGADYFRVKAMIQRRSLAVE